MSEGDRDRDREIEREREREIEIEIERERQQHRHQLENTRQTLTRVHSHCYTPLAAPKTAYLQCSAVRKAHIENNMQP